MRCEPWLFTLLASRIPRMRDAEERAELLGVGTTMGPRRGRGWQRVARVTKAFVEGLPAEDIIAGMRKFRR